MRFNNYEWPGKVTGRACNVTFLGMPGEQIQMQNDKYYYELDL